MPEEYSFKQAACSCGLDLTEKKSKLVGYRRATTPEGKCPKCGRTLPLDAPALKSPPGGYPKAKSDKGKAEAKATETE